MEPKVWRIVPLLEAHARELLGWRYEGIYALYNADEADVGEWMDGGCFACLDQDGALVGHFCFGPQGQVPTVEPDVYAADLLDIGLGLRPDLCGRGMGAAFVELGIAFARNAFGRENLRLTVAAFNERAIRVYKKCGFRIEREVTNARSQIAFYVMRREKSSETPPTDRPASFFSQP